MKARRFFTLTASALLLLCGNASASSCWTPAQLASDGEPKLLKGADARKYASAPLAPLPSDLGRPLNPADAKLIAAVRVKDGSKPIALTFDLCEGPGELAGYDGRIVDLLRARNVRATFFAGGKWMGSHPERAEQLIADPLFEVGNHGWRHLDLTEKGADEARAELLGAQSEYRAARERYLARPCATGEDASRIPPLPRAFRLPYGRTSASALAVAGSLGLSTIQWSIAPGDPSPGVTAAILTDEVLRRARPGAIVVLHANGKGRRTAEALGPIIDGLSKKGYTFVTVSRLLELGEAIEAGRER